MLAGFKRNLRLRRYANFMDYLRDPRNFSLEELRAIANDPLESDLFEVYAYGTHTLPYTRPITRLTYLYSTGKRVPLSPFERGILESGERKRTQEEIRDIELLRGREHLTLKETVHKLYKRFEADIWSICVYEAGYDPDKGRSNTLALLSELRRGSQIWNQGALEVLLVREGLRSAAKAALQERERATIQDQESQADKT